MRLCIRLLDTVEIRVDDRRVDARTLRGRQGRLTLAYLVCHRHRAVPRAELAELHWSEALPRAWDASLSAVVSRLRGALTGSGVSLVSQTGCYRLAAPGDVDIDVERAEALIAEGEAALARGDLATAECRAAEGCELARRSFLPADEGRWIDAQRDTLHTALQRGLEVLTDSRLGRGDVGAAARHATELIAGDPLRETAHQRLIRAKLAAGDRAGAVTAFGRCREILAEELGIDPSPQTQECYLEALRLEAPQAAPPAAAPGSDRDAALPVPQRRIVTATALRLDRADDLAAHLRPDEAQLVLSEALTRATAAVRGVEGAPFDAGNGELLVVFGTTGTHEDDPERAVRAALTAVHAVTTYGAEVAAGWGVPALSVHAGVQTGEIVLSGSGEADRSSVARAAASLADGARPGDVLVSTTTRRLVAPRFSWSAPSGAATVTGIRVSSGKVRGLDGQPAALVGRERELAAGRVAMQAVLGGTGGILLVTGAAGMGKSRLLSELRARLPGTGPGCWLQGTCLSYGDRHPYWPFRELLREWLDIPPETPQLRVRVTLRRALEQLFGWQALDLHATLAPLLGLELEPEAAERIAHLHPDALRRAGFEAVAALLERLGAQAPVVVAIDDLHWADADSLELLEHLLALTERAALLVVLALRPERGHASWRMREYVLRDFGHLASELSLDALPPGADGELLDSLVGTGVLPALARERVLAAAEGNPFYLEELVRSLVADGSLTCTPEGWAFHGDPRIEIPESVGLVIRSRIDRLPASSQAVLAAAAVLGRQFQRDVLAAISVENLAEIDEQLRGLQRVELLREARRWPAPEYRFAHALIQEAAYRALPRKRCRELHRRAARALEDQPPKRVTQSHGELARHWQAAGDARRALPYARLAGDAARDAYARDAASGHYEAAIELARQLPDQLSVRAQLELELGKLVGRAGDVTRSAFWLEAAADAARVAGEADTELDALYELVFLTAFGGYQPDQLQRLITDAVGLAERAGDIARQVRGCNQLAVLAVHDLQFDRAGALSDQALQLARRGGDERVLARALDGRKTAALYLGDLPRLERVVAELEPLLRRHGKVEYLQYVVVESALAAAAAGDWDRATRRADEALALNRRIGHRAVEPFLLALLSAPLSNHGDFDEALANAQAAARMTAEMATGGAGSFFEAWAELSLGRVLLDVAAPNEAMHRLELGLAAAQHHGSTYLELRCVANLAWACWLGAERERACRLLGSVLAAAEASGWWEAIAQCSLWLGQARWAAGGCQARCQELGVRALEAAEQGRLPTSPAPARRLLAPPRRADRHSRTRRTQNRSPRHRS